MPKLTIITPSYAPDFQRCQVLCESLRRFVSGHSEQVIIIDRRDEALFRQLTGPGVRLLLKEDILPGWLRQLPFGRKWWLNLRGLPVRGWILQQIVKLSVAEAIDADIFIFADSDVAFVRPFDVSAVLRDDGRVRLFRAPRKPEDFRDPRHCAWYRHAGKVFGLNGDAFQQSDYISQLVTWRRDTLNRLTERIAEHGGRRWQAVLANTLDFSEYTLYGVFAEHVLGEDSGHYWEANELCYCSWHHAIDGRDQLLQFLRTIPAAYPSVLVQSNLGISPADYAEALRQRQNAGSGD